MAPQEFDIRSTLSTSNGNYQVYRLDNIPGLTTAQIQKLPYAIRILLEGVARNFQHGKAEWQDVENLAHWSAQSSMRSPMPFFAGRVVLQDFTGVPVLNDLAAMRSALARRGGDPQKINPVVPVDLVIDHSVQVDYFASPDAYNRNAKVEFERNRERYEFLHWCQTAFKNLRIVPPASGIIHQVNLEYLAGVVLTRSQDGQQVAFPDTLVGTDSHTTMINGLGVAGWGVGGIEAVAAMLGEPVEVLTPDVIGFRLTGHLPEGTTPTDLTLTIIQKLRKMGVVDKFVEFFGPGLDSLSLADRAMIANMTPECGATMLYFPVDERTLDYLRFTGRSMEQVALVEAYCKAQHLFRETDAPDPEYTILVELDLSSIEPSLAGPKRPQDRVALSAVKDNFQKALTTPRAENGFGVLLEETNRTAVFKNGKSFELSHGSVVIAAITSCTNTSNPYVMLAAGLVAKKAVQLGLQVKPYVKTSLAPGSRVVMEYLQAAGLVEPLEQLGFHLVGYGCTTCIGNSGPLSEELSKGIKENNLVVGAVLSGNRNFEGRVSPLTRANYLASPPLVVAYALAGTLNIDLTQEPIGTAQNGKLVYLRDLWPESEEIEIAMRQSIQPSMFTDSYAQIYTGNQDWNAVSSGEGSLYRWSESSTYLQEPPFFSEKSRQTTSDISAARVLAYLGNSVTTDHISPAGSIAANSPAGQYLLEHGNQPADFNSYGSRRGNDRVMTRGTFANIRIKNLLLDGIEGPYTVHLPSGEQLPIYDASIRYQAEGTPLIVIAGKEYGTGSSRDWAAKGVLLLGVKAVIAESFERIHRSNLAGMGVLPLQFKPGESAVSLGLTGKEAYTIPGVEEHLYPGAELVVTALREDGSRISFSVLLRLDSKNDIRYYKEGGILKTLLANFQ